MVYASYFSYLWYTELSINIIKVRITKNISSGHLFYIQLTFLHILLLRRNVNRLVGKNYLLRTDIMTQRINENALLLKVRLQRVQS